mmetsp:Transcript_23223/g.39910  ORF Transcript_23223/g.39910 Transcript_23223/m.39910 type:complete len:303 (-) Transcript_23223:411-1319(-)|eukprot:CAMPEP_0196656614 /NCGR_PEP_ID=MMETSP1086-20130531/18880_1 /TAXON_ID=77921 /ORGANISM="Cyanoptyche  gloeocystis , Strain SAG4.97" /LENGTH=302 /DNA_ID=CAMNT_0041989445 /DNA_START=160 /DNA_END=1068 /DNA_ORIENTATION=-
MASQVVFVVSTVLTDRRSKSSVSLVPKQKVQETNRKSCSRLALNGAWPRFSHSINFALNGKIFEHLGNKSPRDPPSTAAGGGSGNIKLPPGVALGGNGDDEFLEEESSFDFVDAALTPLRLYLNALKRWPFTANILSAAFIALIGEIIAQRIEHVHFVKRYVKMFGWGLLCAGPLAFNYYRWIDGVIPAQGWSNVGKKILINSVTLTPMINLCFLAYVRVSECLLNGRYDIRDIWDDASNRIRTEYVRAYLNTFRVWPIAHGINFAFVGPQFRVIFTSCVAVFWTAYLSLIGHKKRVVEAPQ